MNMGKLRNKMLLVCAITVLVGAGNVSFAMDTLRGIKSFVLGGVYKSGLLDLFPGKQDEKKPDLWKRGLYAGLRYTGAAVGGAVAYTQLKSGNYKTAGASLLGTLSCLSLGDLRVKKDFNDKEIPSYKCNENFSRITYLPNWRGLDRIKNKDIEIESKEFDNIYLSTLYHTPAKNDGCASDSLKNMATESYYKYYFKHNCIPILLRGFYWAFERIRPKEAGRIPFFSEKYDKSSEVALKYQKIGISDLYNINEKTIINFCAQNPGKNYCNYDFLRRFILGYNCNLRDTDTVTNNAGKTVQRHTSSILKSKKIPEHWLEQLPFELWINICSFIPKKLPKIGIPTGLKIDKTKTDNLIVQKRTQKALQLWLKEKKIIISKHQFIHMLKNCYFKEGSENKEIYNPKDILTPLSIANIAHDIGLLSAKVGKTIKPRTLY